MSRSYDDWKNEALMDHGAARALAKIATDLIHPDTSNEKMRIAAYLMREAAQRADNAAICYSLATEQQQSREHDAQEEDRSDPSVRP